MDKLALFVVLYWFSLFFVRTPLSLYLKKNNLLRKELLTKLRKNMNLIAQLGGIHININMSYINLTDLIRSNPKSNRATDIELFLQTTTKDDNDSDNKQGRLCIQEGRERGSQVLFQAKHQIHINMFSVCRRYFWFTLRDA